MALGILEVNLPSGFPILKSKSRKPGNPISVETINASPKSARLQKSNPQVKVLERLLAHFISRILKSRNQSKIPKRNPLGGKIPPGNLKGRDPVV